MRLGHRFMPALCRRHTWVRSSKNQLGLSTPVPSQMRKCDGKQNNRSGLFIPYRARLAQTLRTPDAFPSLNTSRIISADPPQLHSNNTGQSPLSALPLSHTVGRTQGLVIYRVTVSLHGGPNGNIRWSIYHMPKNFAFLRNFRLAFMPGNGFVARKTPNRSRSSRLQRVP